MAINRFLRDKIIVQKEVQISFDLLLRERVNLNYNLGNSKLMEIIMSVNFKTYSDSWIKAVNDKDVNSMSDVLSNDFIWVNDRFNFKLDKKETIDWCKDTNFQAVDFLCCFENDEVIVGTHNVIEPNALDSTVMFIAKIEDGKIISHQYLREFQR